MRRARSRERSNLEEGVHDDEIGFLPHYAKSSTHFPKFVLHRSTHFHELRKVMDTSKPIDSSAAFLFEVPGSNSPLVVQELQMGGTSMVRFGADERIGAKPWPDLAKDQGCRRDHDRSP